MIISLGGKEADRSSSKKVILRGFDDKVNHTFSQRNLPAQVSPGGLNDFGNLETSAEFAAQDVVVGLGPVVPLSVTIMDPRTVQPTVSGFGSGASFFSGELAPRTLAPRGMSLSTVAAIGILAPFATGPAAFGGTDNYG
jgi:hypothetical protein